jgi:hypothetical protein
MVISFLLYANLFGYVNRYLNELILLYDNFFGGILRNRRVESCGLFIPCFKYISTAVASLPTPKTL